MDREATAASRWNRATPKRTMRILCCRADNYGCAYFRMIVPYSHLGRAHEVIFTNYIQEGLFKTADLVVVQRVSTPEMIYVMQELAKIDKPMLMDIDDNLHSLNMDNAASVSYGSSKPGTVIFEEACGLADVLTVSTPRLAQDYARFAKEIVVCENVLSQAAFTDLSPTEPPNPGPIVRIGYAGSSSHGFDLLLLIKPLLKILDRYPNVRLSFFGQPPPLPLGTVHGGGLLPQRFEPREKYKGRVDHIPFVDPTDEENPVQFMTRYFATLRSLKLDIALIPSQPNVFNAGKSFLKVLEYGACGWPVIASNFGPYREYRNRHPGAILTADDERDWLNNLVRLIEHPELRAAMSQRNREVVGAAYTTEHGIKPWRDLIERFAASPVSAESTLLHAP